jgi:hypothetical protein
MDMAKFEREDDPGFIAVAGELRRWVKESITSESSRSPQLEAEGSQRCSVGEEAGGNPLERQVLGITQGGSEFHGPTTVSGGSLFQGNYVGRNDGIC